jgi:hypothetical protein
LAAAKCEIGRVIPNLGRGGVGSSVVDFRYAAAGRACESENTS